MISDPPVSEKATREREFHNDWARSIDIDELLVKEAFEAPTAIENHYALKELGDLKGKKLLDLGCGAGETSVYLSLLGAEVYACDIAEEFLKVAQALARKYNTKIHTVRAEAGALPFEDQSFDFVYGNGILHHVDLLPAASEIRRVLKNGARAVFIEPLPYNPVINVYRHMAKDVRTEDETPLTLKQINSLRPLFSEMHHEEFWFFSLFIFLHFYFIRRLNPSKVRYWKKVIEDGEIYKKIFLNLQAIDKFLLRALPFLKPLCWNTVVVGTK